MTVEAAPVVETTQRMRRVTTKPIASEASRAGVGYSENARSREAGAEAARQALKRAGIADCDLAILFSTGKHDPVQLREGVRTVIGQRARIFGGYGDGVITNDHAGYDGLQVGVAVLDSDSLQIDMFLETGLPDNEYNVGLSLGRKIKQARYLGEPNLVVLYDTVKEKTTAGASLNMATPLLAGMTEAIGEWPRIMGGALMGSLALNPGYHWVDDRVEQGGAMAMALSGGIRMDTVVMHAGKPSSSYFTITKADRNVVLELDGRPTADLVGELIGPEVDWRIYPIFVPLGVNMGDPFGDYVDTHYISRACQAVDEMRGGLAMFNDDLQVGMRVQLMRLTIDPDQMTQRISMLLEQLADRRLLFALYFDCAGRESRWATMEGAVTEAEEAEIVQRMLGPDIPLLGIYTAGEVAKSGPDMQVRALNFTGVLSIFSEAR
jgi:hypothetical protein